MNDSTVQEGLECVGCLMLMIQFGTCTLLNNKLSYNWSGALTLSPGGLRIQVPLLLRLSAAFLTCPHPLPVSIQVHQLGVEEDHYAEGPSSHPRVQSTEFNVVTKNLLLLTI